MIGRMSVCVALTLTIGTTGCGRGGCPPIPVNPASQKWLVGDLHPQPCHLARTNGLVGGPDWLDVDGAFWALPGDKRFPVGGPDAPVPSCLDVGELLFGPILKGGPNWVWSPLGAAGGTTRMIEVTATGAALPPAARTALTSPDGYPDDEFAVNCVTDRIVELAGHYYQPATGEQYQAGHAPNCSSYAHLRKEGDDQMELITPAGQRVQLVRHVAPVFEHDYCGG